MIVELSSRLAPICVFSSNTLCLVGLIFLSIHHPCEFDCILAPHNITSIMSATSHPYQQLAIDDRVKRVLAHTPLFDGHNDLPQQPRAIFHGKINNNPKFDLRKGFERGMTDIPRLREGAVGAQFWSICVPCLRSAEKFSTPEYSDMARDAIEQIDLTTRMLEAYADVFELVKGPEDVQRIYQSGKIACSIGIEG